MEPALESGPEDGAAGLSDARPDRAQLLDLVEQLRRAGWYVMTPLAPEPSARGEADT